MTQKLIDKAAVVAEIESKIQKYTKRGEDSDARHDGYGMYWGGVISCLNEVHSFLLDTQSVELTDAHQDHWHEAQGDDLPEIGKEVIVLLDNGKVCFAHRPKSEGWYGKNILTGKVEHFTPKTYDKGGWNIPNVKWWLDVDIPVEKGGGE